MAASYAIGRSRAPPPAIGRENKKGALRRPFRRAVCGDQAASGTTITFTGVSTSACRCTMTSNSPVVRKAPSQHNLGLLDRRAGLGQRVGDVARADRAVQLAFGRSVDVDGDAGTLELGEAVGGLGVHRGGLGLVLGALGLELGDVDRRGRHCL